MTIYGYNHVALRARFTTMARVRVILRTTARARVNARLGLGLGLGLCLPALDRTDGPLHRTVWRFM